MRLDGLSLAIELAAARMTLFAPQDLLEQLGETSTGSLLRLLTGGARDLPARQRTLSRTMAWSYDLLGPSERSLLRRVAVFAGGFQLQDLDVMLSHLGGRAGTFPALDAISSLLDKSLLQRVQVSPDSRLAMLQVLRDFCWEEQERAGEADAVRQAHAATYLSVAETAACHLGGPEQAGWLARLEADHDNLRSALRWPYSKGTYRRLRAWPLP